MNDFQELYQEIILDHYKRPRNSGRVGGDGTAKVHENPNCGDSLKLEVGIDDEGKISGVIIDVHGCAISVASASMMTEYLEGKTVEEARSDADRFVKAMRGEDGDITFDSWGDLAALSGVIHFPLRVKCATLAWHAVKEELGTN